MTTPRPAQVSSINVNFPKPSTGEDFEYLIYDLVDKRYGHGMTNLNGRQGQQQNGVDIFARTIDGDYVGIQCKNTAQGISKSVINRECEKARDFTPSLTSFIIYTTAPRDSAIQEHVREIVDQYTFRVDVRFWEDINHDIIRMPEVAKQPGESDLAPDWVPLPTPAPRSNATSRQCR